MAADPILNRSWLFNTKTKNSILPQDCSINDHDIASLCLLCSWRKFTASVDAQHTTANHKAAINGDRCGEIISQGKLTAESRAFFQANFIRRAPFHHYSHPHQYRRREARGQLLQKGNQGSLARDELDTVHSWVLFFKKCNFIYRLRRGS